MGKSNIIEINGRRYDARTGESLDGPVAVEPVADRPKPATGAVVQSATAYHNRLSTKPTGLRIARPAQSAPAPKVRVHDAIKARPQKRHLQRSATLMRSAVKKPAKSLKRSAKAQSPVDILAYQPAGRLQHKASAHQIDDNRLQRARATAKSQAVSRFSRPHGSVPNPPAQLPGRQPKSAEFPASHLPSPAPPPIPMRAHQALDELNDLVEHALQQAASHLEPAPAAPKRRLFWRFND